MADQDKKEEETVAAGTLLVCGATDFYGIGRTKEVRPEYPNLSVPHRLKALEGIKVAFIAAGASACHSVIGDINGACYTWGRNEKGQLGLGDAINRNNPVLVPGLRGKKVVGAAAARNHTVVVTAAGDSYSFGLNQYGQLGTGSVKRGKGVEDLSLVPQLALVSKCSKVACGVDYSMWLCGGKLWSAGCPQYGQLGHDTDHSYNAADSSVKMVFEPQPQPRLIASLAEKTVTQVACGYNHTIAVCSDGGVWTWGFGGYGRLGHKVQQDEFKPRLVEVLMGRVQVPADARVAAGQTASFCTITGGQLFAWGKLKPSGDNLMYPIPYEGLSGWDIRSMTCGSTTFGCAATYAKETSTITWGHSNGYSELGYGPAGKKSSANPDKCMALEGANTLQVAMGFGHTLFLVAEGDPKAEAAPVWEAPCDKDETAPNVGGASKRKAPAAASGGKKASGAAAKKKK
ncbi:hypothetical protein D9Q98_005239 [Chlorella vulgaris]|uniref:RCC1-like domain-containing protein n=1 Tax=Chlorella vulgaris TaxID=3077 RepID=A0A9D4YWP7_CHLVU|nr:hypothetical protein D9Q98_005239 [Chlorella vulgaris]